MTVHTPWIVAANQEELMNSVSHIPLETINSVNLSLNTTKFMELVKSGIETNILTNWMPVPPLEIPTAANDNNPETRLAA